MTEMMEKGTLTVDQVIGVVESDHRSGDLSFELPSGYLDQDGNLHRVVDIRPYTGEEEDILASTNMPMHRRMSKLIENCVTRIGEVSDLKQIKQVLRALSFSDRLYVIVKIRVATNGPIYSFDMKCPECGKSAMQNVDLNEVEFQGLTDPYKRQFSFKLPGTGNVVNWNVMDGIREDRIHQFSVDKDLLSIGIYGRVNDIDGKRVTMEMVKKMSPAQRRALRAEFEKQEGVVNRDVSYECKFCGHEWSADIDYAQASFFFPTDG